LSKNWRKWSLQDSRERKSHIPRIRNESGFGFLSIINGNKKNTKQCIQNSETFIKELSLEEDSAEMYLYYRGQEDMGEVIQEYEKQLIS